MKKTIVLCLAWCICITLMAQKSDFQKTVARYKSINSVTATVTKTVHKQALASDLVTRGGSFVMKPDFMSITTNNGKDKLVMKGTKFTMTIGEKTHTTDSRKNQQFATFHTVLSSITNGGNTDISKLPDVTLTKSGTNLSVTITPVVDSKKARRRMMFQRFVLVLNMKTSEIQQLRMVGRNGDYTDYVLDNYQFQ